ncbi:MAG TPA: phosphatidic acid phosphatase, partial [Erysipelotrichaceae bacterium]|nr:phosphatidic acid phosphatase [Erysipelotrichaceae bacterium]
LKQHSVIDIVLGGLLTLILYKVCMQTDWMKYLRKLPYRKLLSRKS